MASDESILQRIFQEGNVESKKHLSQSKSCADLSSPMHKLLPISRIQL
jgi:hypothetical protein